jgi:hypothetical protein
MTTTEKRRAESDSRLEYLYSFLSEAIALPRVDLSEQIHNASLVRTKDYTTNTMYYTTILSNALKYETYKTFN